MRYTSELTVFGLPLLDVAVGEIEPDASHVARGWIAVGDIALGPILAVGGAAVGGVAIGGLAVGVIPLGGLAAGGLALGGAAVGVFSLGGAAVGLKAAMGGFAVSSGYALGGFAIAPHANDAAAAAFFSEGKILPAARSLLSHSRWLVLLVLLGALAGLIRKRPGN